VTKEIEIKYSYKLIMVVTNTVMVITMNY